MTEAVAATVLAAARKAVDEGGPLALLLIARKGRGLRLVQVNFTEEVADCLLEAASRTLSDLDRPILAYTGDMELGEGEALVYSNPEAIAEAAISEIVNEHPHPLVSAAHIDLSRLLAYALVVGDGGGRIAFLKKSNPGRTARPGRWMTLLGQSLSRIEQPVLAFDDRFDLIASRESVVALSQTVFDAFYRNAPELLGKIPGWVDEVAQVLPMAGNGAAVLAAKCATDSRLRRRLRSIVDRGHLRDVTPDDIRGYLTAVGRNPDDFLDGDLLRVEDTPTFELMYLLNEDLFIGGLSHELFRSDRKSPS